MESGFKVISDHNTHLSCSPMELVTFKDVHPSGAYDVALNQLVPVNVSAHSDR